MWGYKCKLFKHAIHEWVAHGGSGATPGALGTVGGQEIVYLWVCFFCNNQFRLSANADDLETVFTARLQNIGKMVAMLDQWKKPVYLSRIWCIFEQYIATEKQIQIEIIMPAAEASSLQAALTRGELASIKQKFDNIDVQNAKASVEDDEKKVKQAIQQSCGFEKVNGAVKKSMRNWVAQAMWGHEH